MAMSAAPVAAGTSQPLLSSERWTSYSALVLAICIIAWAFDVYEMTVMQLITPLLIKEWGISPATMGNITTLSRWIGLVGTFTFPALADLYGRKPVLIFSILGFSLFGGFTGFAMGSLTLLVFASITRVALAGETPVGMVMVSETSPTKWRATALGGPGRRLSLRLHAVFAGGLAVVPLWGWRALYFIGLLPALMVFWVARGQGEPAL